MATRHNYLGDFSVPFSASCDMLFSGSFGKLLSMGHTLCLRKSASNVEQVISVRFPFIYLFSILDSFSG